LALDKNYKKGKKSPLFHNKQYCVIRLIEQRITVQTLQTQIYVKNKKNKKNKKIKKHSINIFAKERI